jgi:hypothetical protein
VDLLLKLRYTCFPAMKAEVHPAQCVIIVALLQSHRMQQDDNVLGEVCHLSRPRIGLVRIIEVEEGKGRFLSPTLEATLVEDDVAATGLLVKILGLWRQCESVVLADSSRQWWKAGNAARWE